MVHRDLYRSNGVRLMEFDTFLQISHIVETLFFFFVIRHSFTIEDLVSAPNLKLGCAVILRGCASDYKLCSLFSARLDVVDRCEKIPLNYSSRIK